MSRKKLGNLLLDGRRTTRVTQISLQVWNIFLEIVCWVYSSTGVQTIHWQYLTIFDNSRSEFWPGFSLTLHWLVWAWLGSLWTVSLKMARQSHLQMLQITYASYRVTSMFNKNAMWLTGDTPFAKVLVVRSLRLLRLVRVPRQKYV